MSNKTLKLKIATPERVVFNGDVDQVVLPSTEGEITILPNHVPLISSLSSGDIVASQNNELIPMAVVGGFIQVEKDGVVILADFAEHITEITDERIQEAHNRAQKLSDTKEKLSPEELEQLERELEQVNTRRKIAGKWKGKKYRNLNI